MHQFGIGLAGMGNVGAGVYKHLTANRALLRERLGFELLVRKIAVRDAARVRDVEASNRRLRRAGELDKSRVDQCTQRCRHA